MYLGLTYSIAEMSPALPHTGGAYSFARTAFGPWGGFITGIAENIEYVLTPAVVVYFIGTYMTAITGTPDAWQPLWWLVGYIIFVGLNVRGVALSFKVTVIVTLIAHRDPGLLPLQRAVLGPVRLRQEWAMNIGVDASGAAVALPDGHGPFLPFGAQGHLRGHALRGLAVPGHRAAAAGLGGIGRSEARHAQGHHARHVHAASASAS